MNKLDQLIADSEKFDDSGEGFGFDLRLDLASLIVDALKRGVSQREIARRAGMKPAVVNRIVHSEANCTFDSAGRILHAIGVKAAIVPLPINPIGRMESFKTGVATGFFKEMHDGSAAPNTEALQKVTGSIGVANTGESKPSFVSYG